MRKVILMMKEQRKYEVIKKLVETNGNKKRAAVELDLSLRQINRLIAGYITYGKEFFIHGNRNKIPQNFDLLFLYWNFFRYIHSFYSIFLIPLFCIFIFLKNNF